MDIFGVFSLVGGLALFLFGMDAMGKGLEKLSGGRLEKFGGIFRRWRRTRSACVKCSATFWTMLPSMAAWDDGSQRPSAWRMRRR